MLSSARLAPVAVPPNGPRGSAAPPPTSSKPDCETAAAAPRPAARAHQKCGVARGRQQFSARPPAAVA
eukprot:8358507-Lingulodinium_polyedra.AAC.1